MQDDSQIEDSSKSPKGASDTINNLPSDEFLDRELGNAWAIPSDGRIQLAFTRESLGRAENWKLEVARIKRFREELGEARDAFTIRDYLNDLRNNVPSCTGEYGLQPYVDRFKPADDAEALERRGYSIAGPILSDTVGLVLSQVDSVVCKVWPRPTEEDEDIRFMTEFHTLAPWRRKM